MKKILIIYFIIAILIYADEVKYYKVQYGGNIGFVSIGFGKEIIRDHLSMDLSYGYVPAMNTSKEIHSLTAKLLYYPFKFKIFNNKYIIIPLMLGEFINHPIGKQYKIVWESKYPVNYYKPTGIYTSSIIAFGIIRNSKILKEKKTLVYTELSIPNSYLNSLFIKKDIEFHEVITLGLGVAYNL
ncbi:MAG TPA: hypothetical protein PK887_06050 [Ignavibacteriales bacterium]|nr:hypothetical protein [Ignavibacteriales bacterium]